MYGASDENGPAAVKVKRVDIRAEEDNEGSVLEECEGRAAHGQIHQNHA